MDWQDKFTQLYAVIDPARQFPPGYDFEANADALIADARVHAKTLAQLDSAAKVEAAKAAERAAALAKLTVKEREALGL